VPFIHPEDGKYFPEGFSDVKTVIVEPAKDKTKNCQKKNKHGFPYAEDYKKKRKYKAGKYAGDAAYVK
jgi:hypothetical protein